VFPYKKTIHVDIREHLSHSKIRESERKFDTP
jgi:hypothetical protein